MTINDTVIDEFTGGAIDCALWSGMDDKDQPLDRRFLAMDIPPSVREVIRVEVIDFLKGLPPRLLDVVGDDLHRAGHDWWLTRNRHGAGFWDGDYPDHGDELTDHAHKSGEASLHVGDGGQLYYFNG